MTEFESLRLARWFPSGTVNLDAFRRKNAPVYTSLKQLPQGVWPLSEVMSPKKEGKSCEEIC